MTYDEAFYSKMKMKTDNPVDSKSAIKDYGELVTYVSSGGYAYSIFDLDNDLSIRTLIQELIDDIVLNEYPDHEFFQLEIYNLDKHLKSVFIENSERENSKNW